MSIYKHKWNKLFQSDTDPPAGTYTLRVSRIGQSLGLVVYCVMDGFVDGNCRWHLQTTAPRCTAPSGHVYREKFHLYVSCRRLQVWSDREEVIRPASLPVGGSDWNLCFSRVGLPFLDGGLSCPSSMPRIRREKMRGSLVYFVSPHLFACFASISHQITVPRPVGLKIGALDMRVSGHFDKWKEGGKAEWAVRGKTNNISAAARCPVIARREEEEKAASHRKLLMNPMTVS